jgi:hypothetical protein
MHASKLTLCNYLDIRCASCVTNAHGDKQSSVCCSVHGEHDVKTWMQQDLKRDSLLVFVLLVYMCVRGTLSCCNNNYMIDCCDGGFLWGRFVLVGKLR